MGFTAFEVYSRVRRWREVGSQALSRAFRGYVGGCRAVTTRIWDEI